MNNTGVPWRMSVFVLVMLPVLLALGTWQLKRAEEKRVLADAYADALGQLPGPPGEALLPFQRVRLQGRYEALQYFVDNQVRDGQVGYWVVQPFRREDGRRYLINRGWQGAPSDRALLPTVPTPTESVDVVAVVWPDTGLPPLLAADPWHGEDAVRVQRLNRARMCERVRDCVPEELRLEMGQPGSLHAASTHHVFDSARHTGYAVQWFGLAAVLVIGYGLLWRRRVRFGREGESDTI